MDSEFVRDTAPRRAEMLGSIPSSRMRCSSFWVLKVPAATTTWSAVNVVALRIRGPVRAVSTTYPPPWRGRIEVTVCSGRSEEHTSELQSHVNLVCRLLLEKKK